MEYLTVVEVLVLHARLIQRTGGARGVRDAGLLESALSRPQASFDGQDLYPDLWHKAAALMHSLAQNHPFIDENKRTALAATGIFLEMNGFALSASNQEALDLVRLVARGEIGPPDIADWLRAHSRAL